MKLGRSLIGLIVVTLICGDLRAQSTDDVSGAKSSPSGEADKKEDTKSDTTKTDDLKEKTADVTKKVVDKVNDVAEKIDDSEKAKEVSAGILAPIYKIAEYFSFAAFHWVAFALMATGVVSFALQLVISKLILLARMKFSMTQVLTDLLGLLISVVGLVLTTQAAAQNSTFTHSAAAVLSASAMGVVLGFVFFLWGHSQESKAARIKTR